MPQRMVWSVVLVALVLASGAGAAAMISGRQGGRVSLSQVAGPAGCLQGNGSYLDRGVCRRVDDLDGIDDIVVSPDGRHLYALMPWRNTLMAFSRDQRTGELRPLAGRARCMRRNPGMKCNRARAFAGPRGAAITPDGRTLYVSAETSSAVSVFARNRRNGALRQRAGQAGCIANSPDSGCRDVRRLDSPGAIVVTKDGRNVYVAPFYSGVVVLARKAGLTQLPGRRGCAAELDRGCAPARALEYGVWKSMALSPDGRHLYVASPYDTDSSPRGALAVFERMRDGTLRQLPGAAGCLVDPPPSEDDPNFEFYADCGAARALTVPTSVAVTPNGRWVYVAADDTIAIFQRNRVTGALSQASGAAGCVSIRGKQGCTPSPNLWDPWEIVVSPDGRYVYVASRFAVSVYARQGGVLQRVRDRGGCVSVNGGPVCSEGNGLWDSELELALSPDRRHLYAGAGVSEEKGRLMIFRSR
jgi:DNA-binding beta-propeller fold protein YncE